MNSSDDQFVTRLRMDPGHLSSNERGVSHVLGVILVVAIVLTGVVSIVGFGVTGVSDSPTDVSDTAIERDLTGFAQVLENDVVNSDSPVGTTTVDLSLAEMDESRGSLVVDGDAGRLSLTLENGSTAQELVNTSLGLVEYRNPGSKARIAYQSGLVLSAPDASAAPAVVRANQFTHRTSGDLRSLTLHIIRLVGAERIDRQLELSAGNTDDMYPGVLLGAEGTPPEKLVLRIDSTYSEGWELALRDAFPAQRTEVTHTDDELEVSYTVPEEGLFLHAYRHEVAVDGR